MLILNYLVIFLAGILGSIHTQKEISITGPIFITELRARVEFLNTEGVRLDCLAHGEPIPSIKWYRLDAENEKEIRNLEPILKILNNGSLVLESFTQENFNHEVHSAVYKCRAENEHGSILSVPVSVRATIKQQQQQLQAQVHDGYVIEGNVGVLKCQIPTFFKNDFKVIAWIREDNLIIKPNQKQHMIITENAHLHIKDVTSSTDLKLGYWCQIKNKLTEETFLSRTAGQLKLSKPQGGVPATITDIIKIISINRGEDVWLTCAAQGFPPPTYRWKSNDLPKYNRVGTAMHIVDTENPGTFVFTCIVENKFGKDERSTKLIIRDHLKVFITPSSQVVDSGEEFELLCKVSGHPVGIITWTLNGMTLKENKNKLKIFRASRKNEGMYQCFVKNKWETVQATAQVILGELGPVFTKKFVSKRIQPGPSITLTCIAVSRPLPRITWKFNDKEIIENSKYLIKENNIKSGALQSSLEIKNIRTEEGGQYTCSAQNSVGNISHSSNINVYGLPNVHKMKSFTVVADGKISLRCFVSGFPIKDIQWKRARKNRYLPRNSIDYGNGTLVINKAVDRKDEGEYSCFASNGQGQGDKQSTFLEILRKPVLDKNWASVSTKDIHGQFSQMCSVESGDVPIDVFWLKNGRPIVLGHGADIATTKMYSVLQIRDIKDIHRGNYTCVAKNIVGQDSKTVELRVSAPPKWVIKPKSIISGTSKSLLIDCQASGYPEPKVEWFEVKNNRLETLNFNNPNLRIVFHSNGSLEFIKWRESTKSRKFSCVASNGIPPDLTKEIAVDIGVPPKLLFANESVLLTEKDNVRIYCEAWSNSDLTMSWKFKGNIIKTKNFREMDITKTRINYGLSYHIQEITEEKAGQYTCLSTNIYGESKKEVAVIFKSYHNTPQQVTNNYLMPTTYHTPAQFEKTTITKFTTLKIDNENGQSDQSKNLNNMQKNFEDTDMDEGNLDESEVPDTLPSTNSQGLSVNLNMIIFIVPAVVVILLLLALIMTLTAYLLIKKKNSQQKQLRQTLSEDRNSNYGGSLNYKIRSSAGSIDRRYGKLDRPLPITPKCDNQYSRNSGYEIPDYYAGMKPYATLQLSTRYQPSTESSNRESQYSV